MLKCQKGKLCIIYVFPMCSMCLCGKKPFRLSLYHPVRRGTQTNETCCINTKNMVPTVIILPAAMRPDPYRDSSSTSPEVIDTNGSSATGVYGIDISITMAIDRNGKAHQ